MANDGSLRRPHTSRCRQVLGRRGRDTAAHRGGGLWPTGQSPSPTFEKDGTGGGGGGWGGGSFGIYLYNSNAAIVDGSTLQSGAGGSGGAGGQGGNGGALGQSGQRLPSASTNPTDFDGDGITDASDTCVEIPRGTDSNGDGCPDRPAKLSDTDADGIPDNSDACPTVAANTVDGCPPNTTKPTISPISPKPGSTIRDTTPTIKATAMDNLTNLHKANIKLYVNGNRISATKYGYSASTDVLTYNSPRPSKGKKMVKIVATDAAMNVATKSWYFTIKR